MAASKKTYRGRAPLTIAYTEDKRHVFIYRHRIVPEGIPQDEIDRLVGEGFLEEAPATSDADK